MSEKTSSSEKTQAKTGERTAPPWSAPPGLDLEVVSLLGNQATGFLLRGSLGIVQPKLRIGPVGDAYEREADRVADAVLGGPSAPFSISTVSGTVQRRCARCEGECRCHQQEELVQPKEGPGGTSPVTTGFEARVNALRGRGEPLPSSARSFFEPRFGHDFSAVRVHTGAAARDAARAVNARAFTVGNDVVFGAGEYSPATSSGRQLLAHELTHVVQQTPLVARRQPLLQRASQTAPRTPPATAIAVPGGGSPPVPITPSPVSLRRKIRVDRPGEPIPNPTGTGRARTNAEAVEGYLRRLAPDGGVRVDRNSGEASMRTGYCPGVLGGLIQGARFGYRIGNLIGSAGGHIPLLGPIFGAVGAVFGALIGSVAGLFGAQSPSPAAASRTPTGSTCVCDFVHSSQVLTIQLNDELSPAGAATMVRVPSPNSRRTWGNASVTGQLMETEPWLILGHEMCGHAYLARRGGDEEGPPEQEAPLVGRSSETGDLEIQEGEPGARRQPRAQQFLRHGRTVDRENLIRAEQGIAARGYRLRDPYCGESFWRERDDSQRTIHWQPAQGVEGTTYLQVCEHLRGQLPESRTRRYRIDERIPEETPAAGGTRTLQRKVSSSAHFNNDLGSLVRQRCAIQIQRSPLSDSVRAAWTAEPTVESLLARLSQTDVQQAQSDADVDTELASLLTGRPDDLWVAQRVRRGRLGETTGARGPRVQGRPVPRPIEAFFFRGATALRALVIAGVHGTERQGIEVARRLIADLQTRQPHYTVIVVPSLFPDNAARGRFGDREGSTPTNRNFPPSSEDLAAARTAGGGTPVDASTDRRGRRRREILPENLLLMELMERFRPQRIISIHGTHREGAAGVFYDPRSLRADEVQAARQWAAGQAYMRLTPDQQAMPEGQERLRDLEERLFRGRLAQLHQQSGDTDRDLSQRAVTQIDTATTGISGRAGRSLANREDDPATIPASQLTARRAHPSVAGNVGPAGALDRFSWSGSGTGGVSLGEYAPRRGMSVFTVEPPINRNTGDYPIGLDPITLDDRRIELQAYADAVRTVLLGA